MVIVDILASNYKNSCNIIDKFIDKPERFCYNILGRFNIFTHLKNKIIQ